LMRAALAQPISSERDTLDGIGQAFSAAMAHDGGPIVVVVVAILVLAMAGWLFFWLLRETRRERSEQGALDARHEAARSTGSVVTQRREWLRVPAHVHMTVQHAQGGQRFWYEESETQNIGGGGVAFLSRTPPPPGCPVHFTLDLGERTPVSLRGVVVRVEPSTPGKPSLVALKFGPCTAGEREQVVRWVAQEQESENEVARQGRPCPFCGRPLADEAMEAHSTCEQMAKERVGDDALG
jgi:hypothetical protein